jgi:glycosyltransferase involved in cell wall biosynthesis
MTNNDSSAVPTSQSLTIVIPTRERSDTLRYAIESCVAQSYANLRILVVDNFSQDDTATVVRSFSDKRIEYINSGRRLSMSANWELALQQVQTDYVMFIGDDDGVLPEAVSDLMDLVAHVSLIDAITWPSVEYGWPSCANPLLRDTIVIPLTTGTERRKASAVLQDVISFRRPYSELPFIYKGMVKTDVITKLRAASGGVIFHSMIPDVYFSISSCSVIEHYLYSYRAYTVNGASGHSNGTSFAGQDGKEAEKKFLAEDNIPFHSSLPYCSSIPILVLESLMQAQLRLPDLAKYSVSLDTTIQAAINQVQRADKAVFDNVLGALRRMSRGHALSPDTVKMLATAIHQPYFDADRVYGVDVFNHRALVNCHEFHVKDCFQAGIVADMFRTLHTHRQLSTRAALRNAVRLLLREFRKRTGWFQ